MKVNRIEKLNNGCGNYIYIGEFDNHQTFVVDEYINVDDNILLSDKTYEELKEEWLTNGRIDEDTSLMTNEMKVAIFEKLDNIEIETYSKYQSGGNVYVYIGTFVNGLVFFYSDLLDKEIAIIDGFLDEVEERFFNYGETDFIENNLIEMSDNMYQMIKSTLK